MRRRFLRILPACLLLGSVAPSLRAEKRYLVGILPQFAALKLHADWQPLLRRIVADTGIVLEMRTFESVPRFEAAFLRGELDFAYLNPWHAVMARRAQGYEPLVRDTRPLNGVLVVRRDGPADLAALDGKPVGMPSANAFGGSLYMRALLAEKHGVRVVPRYLTSHANIFRHVIAGEVAAGGSAGMVLEQEPAAVREQLRILYHTPDTASPPLAVHPSVPETVRRRVVAALLALRDTPEGRALLQAVRMPEPVAADYARDYRPLEGLRLDRYMDAGGGERE